MPRGRPSKPLEDKRRIGTLRQDRTPGLANLAAVPALDLSGWELSPDAALERVLQAGVPWLAATDHPKVALLREALELHGRTRDAGLISLQLDVMKEVRILMAELGFDPTSRSKLGLAEVKAQSTLENLRASRQAKVSNPHDAG